MKKATSITIGHYLERALEGHPNTSQRIDIIAARYQEILKRHCPTLTMEQWYVIADVYSAHLHTSMDDAQSILHQLKDADDFDEISKTRDAYNVNIDELCNELTASGTAGMFAAIEVGQRFWMTNRDARWNNCEEQFRSLGARVK